ncbi:MAG: S-layer homology domain-containing protein, partial [Oscillospiraceae bacterium]
MKSLNRTLSLVLVLVMVLGMFGIAGAAFTDSATVQYKEAVDVMSAIGVINGMETGAFNPKGNLTREQAAKIVCYLTMGKTAADNLKTSVAPFKDVNADRWSAGSIAYCVQQGIISGRGDGTFDPAANVTGYEFAKMLLVALGYDATIEQFTGPSWNINVAKRAYANGLFDGNDVNGSVAANREEAALYALNLIQAKLVTYANKGSNIIVNGTVINTTASEPSQKDNATFMKTYHPKLDVTPDYDVFGSDANRWTLNGKEIGRYATRTALTFTAEAEGATVAAQVASMGLKNHTIKVDADKNSTVYPMINGVKQAAINNVTEIPALTANGRVVKIYTDKDNSTIITGITVIDTELAQITKINAATKTVSVKTMAGATITIDSDNPNYATLSAMAVKDYVLVTPVMVSGVKTIATVAIPKTVTGTLTKISTDKAGNTTAVTVGGNSYDLSFKEEDVGGLTGSAMSSKKEITLYLDSFGYAIYVTNATVATPYIGVVKISQTLVNNVIINMVTGYAPDGSVVTLNIGSKTADKNGTLYSYAP